MNALVGERMSIITNKPQTTRHRIVGIISGDYFQIVFSDTPGIIKDPKYKMQEAMNRFVRGTFEDADLMLFVTEVTEEYKDDDPIFEQFKKLDAPKFLVLNKIDLVDEATVLKKIKWWSERVDFSEFYPISALKKKNTPELLEGIKKHLPEH